MSLQTSFAPAASRGKIQAWAGWGLTGLVTAFLLMDSVMKLLALPIVIETNAALGVSESLARPLGILLLACTALYLLPRTSVMGAVLLTGYLGGAVAIHLRAGSPLASHVLFGVYLGALAWGGLLLRNAPLRRLLLAGRG